MRWMFILLVWPMLVFAFGDDICFLPDSTEPFFNCVELHETCYPLNTDKACKTQTAHHTVDAAATVETPRSMVHLDATFYIAQAVGIPYDEAHQIAAYDQSIDLSGYVPMDRNGDPMVDLAQCDTDNPPVNCKYVAKEMNALSRTNLYSGGTFFHYGVLNNPSHASVNGFNPLKNDPLMETMVTNVRAWIFLEDFLLCTAGLNGITTGTCFQKSSGEPGKIFGTVPVLEDDDRLDQQFNITITEQILHQTASETIYAHDIEGYVGTVNKDAAKMGLYLHVLQDRISHHGCMDTSYLSDPKHSIDENFIAHYDSAVCNQGTHLVWHGWETGQHQEKVPVEQQTIYPSLELTFDELLVYAERHGFTSSARMKDKNHKKAILDALYIALQLPTPDARLDAMIKSMKEFGLQPLPGH